MKKRDFFAVLVAGAAIAVAAQALFKWLWGESDYDEDYDYEDDGTSDLDDEEMDDLLECAYDEGFADGFNGDYQGCNPAAQVLQAELNTVLEECAMCECGIIDEEEGAGESEVAEESEGQTA